MKSAHFQGPARASVSLPRTPVSAPRLISVRTCVFLAVGSYNYLERKTKSAERELNEEMETFYCERCEKWWFQKEKKGMVGYCGCDNREELSKQGFYFIPDQDCWYQDGEARGEMENGERVVGMTVAEFTDALAKKEEEVKVLRGVLAARDGAHTEALEEARADMLLLVDG